MNSGSNIRFELEINGQRVSTAGVEGFGVLSAILSWARRDPARFDAQKLPHSSPEKFAKEDLRVEFGGLDSNDPLKPVHQAWHQRDLKVGDVVTIRILGPGDVDAPLR